MTEATEEAVAKKPATVKKAAPKAAPAKKPAAKPAPKKAEAKKEEFAYGMDYVAKALDSQPNLVRVKLRAMKVKKSGKSYGWKTKAEADAIVKQLKAK